MCIVQSYVSTRLAAKSADEVTSSGGRTNAWLLVLDAANFAGPVSYTLPDYWKFDNNEPVYGLTDFGMDSASITHGSSGFEIDAIPGFIVGG